MTAATTALDHARQVLGRRDPRGELVPCEIREIRIGPDELSAVAARLTELLDRDGTGAARPDRAAVLLIQDRTPIRRAGTAVKPWLAAQLEERFDVRTLVLDDGHDELHASEEVLDQAAAAAAGMTAIVSVGGGTISDVGKVTSARTGDLPLLVVQTAASVDGYTDNVSVILRNGVKRTVPSRWPDVVLADTTLIAEAPARMNRAGFGEINSTFTAPADWRLANLLGFDPTFHRAPVELLGEVSEGIEDWSRGLATADRGATERLVRALAIRGIVTGVAGSTACLSGAEHLISHMLDISQAARGRPIGLHGAQVGVGSVVAAAAWEALVRRLDDGGAERADPARTLPDPDALAEQVQAPFLPLDPSGALAGECWADYRAKVTLWRERQDAVREFLHRWAEHRDELRALVSTPEQIATVLRASGSPARFEELEPGIPPDLARWAVQHCALMRNRFTVVDLLTLLGWWTEDDVTAVMDRAAAAVDAAGALR